MNLFQFSEISHSQAKAMNAEPDFNRRRLQIEEEFNRAVEKAKEQYKRDKADLQKQIDAWESVKARK